MPDSLEALLLQPEPNIDPGIGNLLIGKRYNPRIDVADYDRQLNAICEAISSRIGSERDPYKVIGIINAYVFNDLKLQAQDSPYTTDFLLHELLRTRRGRCSALVSLYMSIGHRLNLPFRSICIPEHIFVVGCAPQRPTTAACNGNGQLVIPPPLSTSKRPSTASA